MSNPDELTDDELDRRLTNLQKNKPKFLTATLRQGNLKSALHYLDQGEIQIARDLIQRVVDWWDEEQVTQLVSERSVLGACHDRLTTSVHGASVWCKQFGCGVEGTN